MDKGWINLPRSTKQFENGVSQFLKFVKDQGYLVNGKLRCPCRKCGNKKWLSSEMVREDLILNGFLAGYTNWVLHGEKIYSKSTRNYSHVPREVNEFEDHAQDQIRELIDDAFGFHGNTLSEDLPQPSVDIADDQNIEFFSSNDQSDNDRYNKMLQESEEELYPGSKFSRLSFLIQLYHLKCFNGWSAKSFDMLLQLLREAFPDGVSLPVSYYEAKKIIKELGLGYEKIHACPNDCMLYWGDSKDKQFFFKCRMSRWKSHDSIGGDESSVAEAIKGKKKNKPAKVFRYFPLIPRLRRFFMSPKTAQSMIWHDVHRTKDGILRHPADAIAWKAFDDRYPEFASDARNVRIALASDGFNPFRTMSSTYSTWPVVLIPYNMEPWVCMKSSSIILSSVIPGEKGPGNDIDIFLQPLIVELLQLWKGVETYDANRDEVFNLRAVLLWTINDFPAYANLSGWSTKGRVGCPCCAEGTYSRWLTHEKKFCCMGHRRWLPIDHPFRSQADLFDGTIETQTAPIQSSGTEILKKLADIHFEYGKTTSKLKKRPREDVRQTYNKRDGIFEYVDDNIGEMNVDVVVDLQLEQSTSSHTIPQKQIWKKRSILFDLPYWEFNLLRHNLDVMHVEKNVCDNLLGTLLDIEGKSKDNLKARMDLKEIGIRPEYHPVITPDSRLQLPSAPYTMSRIEKDMFLTLIKNLKMPDGYASNISRCVSLKDRKISNMKSHDGHVLMQDIMPLALDASKGGYITEVISNLSSFFIDICSKTIDPRNLKSLQEHIVFTLCEMEKHFPPGFFTIMVHLLIHLVDEVRLGGPVHYRWMYPIERLLVKMKGLVRNRAQPEGSIAEGYVVQECLTFCSRYLDKIETTFTRPPRNYDVTSCDHDYIFSSRGRYLGKSKGVQLEPIMLDQAHRYVLIHSDSIQSYREEFLSSQKVMNRNLENNKSLEDKLFIEVFPQWLQEQVPKMINNKCPSKLIVLARGPNRYSKRATGLIINGFRFHTKDRESNRVSQNSGVMVEVEGRPFFGVLTDIYELDYYGCFKVILFRCDWVDVYSHRGMKEDSNGRIRVNFSRLIHTGVELKDDPFVFSSQARQVFYVQDPKDNAWWNVVKVKPRDLYDIGLSETEYVDDFDSELESNIAVGLCSSF